MEVMLPVGMRALTRLCAPLPFTRTWRAAVRQIAALRIRCVELAPEWLLETNQIPAANLADMLRDNHIRSRIARLPLPALGPEEPRRLPLWDIVDRSDHFLLPKGQVSEAAPPVRLMREMAEGYAVAGATLLLENGPGAWPPDGETLGRFVAEVDHPGLAACYDPAADVALKKHPFLNEFLPGPLKRAIGCLRLRDAVFEDGHEVLLGQGNAELKELVSALECRQYDGWYILSPFGRGSYPARLQAAYEAAREMFADL